MAVIKAPVRQQSYLTEYDRQMAEYLRQMGGSIGAQDIAAEAYGGKFPVGTMTAKILSGVLAGASDRRAMNREDQAKKAQIALLTGAQEYATPLPTKFEGAGKFTDAQGNFTQELAPVYQGVTEDANKAAFDARMLKKYYPEGVLAGGATPPGEVAVATVTGPRSQFEVAGGADLQVQPEPEIIPSIEPERKQLYPQETVQGMTIEGSKKDPDWWDRNISGDIPEVTVKNQIELAQLAGYDPLEYMTFAQRTKTQGHRILSTEEAIAEGITNAKEMAGNDGFFQKNLTTNKIDLVGGGGDTTNITVSGPDQKYGIKSLVERFGKKLDQNFAPGGILDKSKSALRVSNNLLGLLETGDFKTGKWAPYRDWLYKHAAELGWLNEKELNTLAGMDTFTAESNQIVLKFIKNLGRNPTDLDLTFMIQTMPNIGKSILANKMIIKMGSTVEQHNVKYLTALDNYRIDRNLELQAQGKDYTVESNTHEISLYEDKKRQLRNETQELLDADLKKLQKEILQIEEYEGKEGSNYTYDVIIDPDTGELIFKN